MIDHLSDNPWEDSKPESSKQLLQTEQTRAPPSEVPGSEVQCLLFVVEKLRTFVCTGLIQLPYLSRKIS